MAPKRGPVVFIFITVMLDMLALGVIIPVLPKLIENFLGGDTGRAAEIIGLFATVWAYISDVTPPEKRSQGFGMLGMAFGIGFILGPALGGILGDVNPRLPFWGAAFLTLINTLYGAFVLPESLAKENRVKFEWRKLQGANGSLRGIAELIGPGVFTLHLQHSLRLRDICRGLHSFYRRYSWQSRRLWHGEV
jgi:MFS transporter, DHA1 family, tetracycline resistance protein